MYRLNKRAMYSQEKSTEKRKNDLRKQTKYLKIQKRQKMPYGYYISIITYLKKLCF